LAISEKSQLRILHVVGGMVRGGAENMIMNYYRHVDKNKFQFDFLTMLKGEHDYNSEIRELGGRIFCIKPPKETNVFKHFIDILMILRRYGPFQAVHSHTMFHSGYVMLAAKLAGVKIRICHSHLTSDTENNTLRRRLYRFIMRLIIMLFSNKKVACGKDAGIYLFGRNIFSTRKLIIMPNALDLSSYNILDQNKKISLKRKYGIVEDVMVIGHVGRFAPQKNHKFFIGLMKEFQEMGINVFLILVGEGPLRQEFEKELKEKCLMNNVIFLGNRQDVPQIMNMFDIFVFPSLYEGLPLSVLEAQAVGLPCLVSSSITKEVDMGLGLVTFIDIKRDVENWCMEIIRKYKHKRPSEAEIISKFRERGYDIRHSANILLNLYSSKKIIKQNDYKK